MTEEEKIIERVEGRRDEIIRNLSKLIRIPSRTGEEGEAQVFVAGQYRGMGLDVDVWEPDVRELFEKFPVVAQYPSHWEHDLILPYHDLPTYEALIQSEKGDLLNYKDRPNVVGRWKGAGAGRSLILNGHIDTVTIEPKEEWTHDPFGAEIKDGRIFGRGASDMKAGIISAMEAVHILIESGVRLRGDVILESVVNEEHAGNGTLACIARGYVADAAILGEPSENRVRLGAYGAVYWGINLRGKVLHTSGRWEGDRLKGVSAIEKLPAVINALIDLESVQNKKPVSVFYAERKPFALTMGRVWGGAYDTASAGSCSLRGSIYFSPEIGSITDVMDWIKAEVRKAAEKDPWLQGNRPEVLFFHHDDGYRINAEEEIVKGIQASGKKALQREIKIVPGVGANDCRHLVNQGKIPSAVFGPGGGGQSHTIDESVSIEDVISNVKALALIILDWCR